MRGYAVAGRIEGSVVRARPAGQTWLLAAQPGRPDRAVVVELSDPRPGLMARLSERFDDMRTELGQLTWYVFNQEGWR